MQVAVNAVQQWSTINKLQLNVDKCKELVIDFYCNSALEGCHTLYDLN